MEVLNKKELKSIVRSVDGYNDYGLDTFAENLTDYCDEVTDKAMDEILAYVEDDLDINTDAELKSIQDDAIEDLCEYINSIF
ncbi:hypothetical protein EZV73_18060 [Acidaminobacter sp. JC074]|uniref:hypothetical protein n=1 Tax=Acidaminobacter sp. JC074 TaxID=2530199 RepID=UPI001F10F2AB|nr:hypothetical protein [Acidaminobacter sp. JC074]MCH4889491.1 hypothetical protein [Acidaminobacter sp. JC074]